MDEKAAVTAERSAMMRAVRNKDTRPEMAVRRTLHALGLRFRLHRSDLPGRPDIVLPRRRLAVFVHGCFWHRHEGCRRASTPKTRTEFWNTKFTANQARDLRVEKAIHAAGWDMMVIWECEVKDKVALRARLARLRDLPPPTPM